MKQYYGQQAKMVIQPGKRDECIAQLKDIIAVLQHTPGCVYYLISTTEEPDVVWISELWTSKEAKDALAANPESVQAMKELTPFIASIAERAAMTVVSGFGLE
jgi:quinol monooxygenase YgiN